MEMDDLPTQYIPTGSLAYIYLHTGELEQAKVYLAKQSLCRILIDMPQPDYAQAQAAIEEAIEIFAAGDGRISAAIAQFDLIKLHLAQRQFNQARPLLTQIIQDFDQLHIDWYKNEAEKLQKTF